MKKGLHRLDELIETPVQEFVEINQEVLNCSRSTVLKVYGVLGSLGAGVAMYLDDHDVDEPLLAIGIVVKYLIYVHSDYSIKESDILSDEDSSCRTKKAMIYFALGCFGHDLFIHALDVMIYDYLCNRYHDTGSKMRDYVKSKVDSVLKNLKHKVQPA